VKVGGLRVLPAKRGASFRSPTTERPPGAREDVFKELGSLSAAWTVGVKTTVGLNKLGEILRGSLRRSRRDLFSLLAKSKSTTSGCPRKGSPASWQQRETPEMGAHGDGAQRDAV
jgi:hypothetical protein